MNCVVPQPLKGVSCTGCRDSVQQQWAIGDWLVDGKRHYGDGLYNKAAGILGVDEKTLRNYKSQAGTYRLSRRRDKLSWRHHSEVASLKIIVADTLEDRSV